MITPQFWNHLLCWEWTLLGWMGQSQTSRLLYYPLAPWILYVALQLCTHFAMIEWIAYVHDLFMEPGRPSISRLRCHHCHWRWRSRNALSDHQFLLDMMKCLARRFWSIIVQLHGTVKSADVPKLKVHSPHSVLDSRLFSLCKVPPQHCHQGAQTDNFRHYSDRIELILH